MLIQLTNKCFFECWHCLRNSNRDGQHMSDQTFFDVVKFIEKYKPKLILITGGEPTLHPKFKQFVKHICKATTCVINIASNGWFIDKNGDIPDEFKFDESYIGYQISNDSRYYPKKVNAIYGHKDYDFFQDKIKRIFKCSKLKNATNVEFSSTMTCANICMNTIMNSHCIHTFKDILNMVESKMKFCTPYIDINGKIFIGETDICSSIGTIYDSDETLMKNINTFNCNNCNNFENQCIKIIDKLLNEF